MMMIQILSMMRSLNFPVLISFCLARVLTIMAGDGTGHDGGGGGGDTAAATAAARGQVGRGGGRGGGGRRRSESDFGSAFRD